MKMNTRATKTEKCQLEVEWKMDKSIMNAKYCDIESGKQEKSGARKSRFILQKYVSKMGH